MYIYVANGGKERGKQLVELYILF